MSSWKKASKVNQKVHRERHQLEARTHLGLLEKKKDYKLRANDFNKKKGMLKSLRRQALNRNPDEFYFNMINSKLVDGKHREKRKTHLSEDSIEQKKLMANSRLSYVRMKKTIETKKIEKIKSEMCITDLLGEVNPNHIYFSDSEEDIKISRKVNSDSESDIEEIGSQDIKEYMVKRIIENKKKKYNELSRRIEREKQLQVIQQKMEVQCALKKKSSFRPKLVKEGSKNEAPIYVWKYERKR